MTFCYNKSKHIKHELLLYERMYRNEKITRKIVVAMSAVILFAVHMINSFYANATVTKCKTDASYDIANTKSNIQLKSK